MLRSVEISAILLGPADNSHFTRLQWERRLELSLDCFVCERVGRTTFLEWGAERAVCTSDEEHGRHFTAARIAAFDHTTEDERSTARAIVDFWWAPFHDAKRDVRALPLTHPWVRLALSYYCPNQEETGESTIQTNLARPFWLSCKHCKVEIATTAEAPTIRLLT